jgi:hypothetical protein
MVNPYRFYTYAYLREDRTPYYIGKGKGYRIKSKQRNINQPKDKSRVIFLKQNLTEEEAFKHEKYMIAVFGRKDLGSGILHNKSDGGEGVSNPSNETREKKRKAKIGKKHSEETKNKIRQSRIGQKLSKEHKEKIGKKMKGRFVSNETRKKLSKIHKGKKRENLSTEAQEKMRENAKKNCSQKWMCLETGYITNSGALTHYQKARNIDTSKRKRLE